MRLIALLNVKELEREVPAGDLAPDVHFGSQSLVEYQARLALAAGVDEIIIHADAASGDLMRATDRLMRESDVPISLVNDGPALIQRLESGDRVLMLGERMILPLQAIETLADTLETTLLVTPGTAASAMLERIDATHVWAGGALLSVDTVGGMVGMPGDWDLALTLLRCAVQQQAQRIELSPELISTGMLVAVRTQADADRAVTALSVARNGDDGVPADGLARLMEPVARPLVAELVRRQVDAGHLSHGAGVLAVMAMAVVTPGWSIVALLLALLAEGAFVLSLRSADITLRTSPKPWLRLLVRGSGLAVLAVIGGRLAGGSALALTGVGLPLLLVALLTLAGNRLQTGLRWATFARPTIPVSLAVALVCTILGGPAAAFVLIGLLVLTAIALDLFPLEGTSI